MQQSKTLSMSADAGSCSMQYSDRPLLSLSQSKVNFGLQAHISLVCQSSEEARAITQLAL